MILERLSLTDVGPYAGTQTIDLAPPNRRQPVVLITALNGAGKTTLMEAINLALYGKHANLSKRGEQTHEQYLARLINRDADPAAGSGIDLQVRYRRDGHDRVERILRTWHITGAGRIRENCQILVRQSPVGSENNIIRKDFYEK